MPSDEKKSQKKTRFGGSGTFDTKAAPVVGLLSSLFSAPIIFGVFVLALIYSMFFYGFTMAPTNLAQPFLDFDSSHYFPNPNINVSEILLGPALPFIVIIGPHDIGKTIAVQLAASDVSTSRAVVYLPHPPSDFEFFKLFYQMPSWLKGLGLLDLFLSIRSITFTDFVSRVNVNRLPVLIIDNIQSSHARLPELLSSVKHYANAEVMKIVLVCSSSTVALTISELSAMSRGQFVSFPRLPQDMVVKMLLRRGFTDSVASKLSSQLGPSLTKIKTVSLTNPDDFVDMVKRDLEFRFNRCVRAHISTGSSINVDSLIGPDCCSPIQTCLLQANFLMFDPLHGSTFFDSDLARVVVESAVKNKK